jgi:aldehyde dehydrogenase (NAD+)
MQLTILTRNGERGERAIAKRDRSLDFGERWSYAPAPEAHSYIKLHDRYQLFIGGKFVAPKSGEYFDSVNPATEEKLAEISSANEKDVDLAVKAARRAYKNVWSKTPGRERGKYLFRIARLIQEKARELAVLETMDGGKTIKESRDIDLPLMAAHFFTTRAGPTNSTTLFLGGKCGRSASRARSFPGISRC